MKIDFANYTIINVNIGDNAQVYALDRIYEKMGIPQTDIVHFNRNNVHEVIQKGHHYILPLAAVDNFYFDLVEYLMELGLDQQFSFVPISLGMTRRTFRNEEGLSKFRHIINKFEMPIGCRDYDSAELYQNLGYSTYVNGCITNTFPHRDDICAWGGKTSAESRDKVYIIDVPRAAKEYIPKGLYDEAVFLSQIINMTIPGEEIYQLTKERYELLRDTARLVITRRYHIATPCCAMGIPVIMLESCDKNYHWTSDQRFPAMNPNIHFYTKENWKDINWDPAPVDFEDQKNEMCDLIISRIKNAACIAAMKNEMDLFYAPSKKRFHETFLKNRSKTCIYDFNSYLDRPFLSQIEGDFRYYLYGLSDRYVKVNRCILIEYIQRHYPRAEFLGFVDGKKTGKFMDKDILSPSQMKVDEQTYCLVSAYTANDYVARLFDEKGWDKTHLWLMPRQVVFYVYHM